MKLEDALADVDKAIHDTNTKMDKLQDQLSVLQDERRGIELALSRHGRGGALAPTPDANEWLEMNRTDAVERVLVESGTPLSPTQITNRLGKVGRDDSDTYVSAALSYLQKEKRAYRVSRGQWMAGKNPLPTALAVVGGASAILAATKDGGGGIKA